MNRDTTLALTPPQLTARGRHPRVLTGWRCPPRWAAAALLSWLALPLLPESQASAQTAANFHSSPVGTATAAQTLTVAFTGAGAIGALQMLTMGAPNLDFTDAGGGTCIRGASFNVGSACTVNVVFTPKFAGTRNGVVNVLDANGAVIAAARVYGTGTGPQVAYASNAAATALGGGFSGPDDLAVDGGGNVYVADYGNNAVKEVPAGCTNASCVTTLGGTFGNPLGVAVDGGGAVYVTSNGVVYEMPPGCARAGCATALGGGFGYPNGVAVDGSGNVYVADTGKGAVYAMPPGCASENCVTAIGGGFGNPFDVAVDGGGNVYVAQSSSGTVKEIPAGCTSASCVTSLGGGFSGPYGVAVDGTGNVYVADNGSAVYEMPAGCASASCVTRLGVTFGQPEGVAVDGSGNIYVTDTPNDVVAQIDRSTAPSLTFARTALNATSSDSPQTVTLLNIGNAPLTFAVPAAGTNPSLPANFTLGATGTCPQFTSASSAGTLAAGASCTLPVEFSPTQATAAMSGSLVLIDNDLNGTSAAQTIRLNGSLALTAVRSIASRTLTANVAATSFAPVTGAGGAAPYTYSLAAGQTLPAGLRFDAATGAISGTPTAFSAATAYTVTVTGADNAVASANFTLAVDRVKPTALEVPPPPSRWTKTRT